MKNKGFTLVELLGVIVIISTLTLLVVPSIINYVRNRQNEIGEVTRDLIFSGADAYVSGNYSKYPKITENQYCVTLNELVEHKYLSDPIVDVVTGKEIDLNKYVKVNYTYDKDNKINKFTYELTDTCNENRVTQPCTVVSGTGKNMGDKIYCSEEYFYVLSYTSDNIEMLAEHPIATSGSTIKQVAGSYMTVRFASSQYWTTSGFVYNSNSLLYSYVEDYVKYLKSLGLSSASGTLIDYDKYLTSTKMNSYSANIKSWLTPSSLYYWTGTTSTTLSYYVYQVENGVVTFEHYSDTGHIRPVINISPSEVGGIR